MAARGRIDQLCGDAQSIAGAANAAFHRVADTEVAADLADIHRTALVGERRIACDHEQRADARERRGDVLDQAIDKIDLLRIAAHVLEWQHHEGGFVRQRQTWQRRGGRCVARDDDVGRQQVTAPGHRLENPLCVVPNGATNVADTLRYAIVCDRDTGPDRPIDRIAVEQPSGVFHKEPQQFEGLSPKRTRLTRRRKQRPTPDVQNETIKAVGRDQGRGVHRGSPDSTSGPRWSSKQKSAHPRHRRFQ